MKDMPEAIAKLSFIKLKEQGDMWGKLKSMPKPEL
jgi:hypothetical protein